MLVELDAFSGRPNPRWELDDATAASLRGLVARLAVTTEQPPQPPGLGYRGFLFEAAPHGRARAYAGFVSARAVVLADPSSSVERHLLGHMPAELEDVRRRITHER